MADFEAKIKEYFHSKVSLKISSCIILNDILFSLINNCPILINFNFLQYFEQLCNMKISNPRLLLQFLDKNSIKYEKISESLNKDLYMTFKSFYNNLGIEIYCIGLDHAKRISSKNQPSIINEIEREYFKYCMSIIQHNRTISITYNYIAIKDCENQYYLTYYIDLSNSDLSKVFEEDNVVYFKKNINAKRIYDLYTLSNKPYNDNLKLIIDEIFKFDKILKYVNDNFISDYSSNMISGVGINNNIGSSSSQDFSSNSAPSSAPSSEPSSPVSSPVSSPISSPISSPVLSRSSSPIDKPCIDNKVNNIPPPPPPMSPLLPDINKVSVSTPTLPIKYNFVATKKNIFEEMKNKKLKPVKVLSDKEKKEHDFNKKANSLSDIGKLMLRRSLCFNHDQDDEDDEITDDWN